ncbi:MAG: hypothetical protein LBS89_06000, partial [Zoogloeaceae bacterium]|nr:hypothetical protein [Zoogloeaceae bacterium]
KKDGVSLSVHFQVRVPVDKARPLAVSLVIYEIPWTPQNVADMAKAARAKYGVPSNDMPDIPNQLSLAWCEKPHNNPGIGCADPDQASLGLGSTSMRLEDPAWQNAVIQFMRDSQATKPNF